MRRSRMVLTASFILAALLSLAHAGAAGTGDLVAELAAIGDRLDEAVVAGNFETVLSFYAEDAVVMPNFQERLEGREAIRARMDADREAGLSYASATGSVEKAWECDGMVYGIGRYAVSVSLRNAPRPISDEGKFMTVWRRGEDGSLRIVYEIWNTDMPARR
ncbi:MAG: YybH family protein [Acidobacteriota bacterium]